MLCAPLVSLAIASGIYPIELLQVVYILQKPFSVYIFEPGVLVSNDGFQVKEA